MNNTWTDRYYSAGNKSIQACYIFQTNSKIIVDGLWLSQNKMIALHFFNKLDGLNLTEFAG